MTSVMALKKPRRDPLSLIVIKVKPYASALQSMLCCGHDNRSR
jgi:hypothetical protein